MSAYGECLKKYIKENGMSVRKLSIETGINRTLIQKYLSGDRLPKNAEEVRLISEGLMLSPEKQEDLMEQYNRSSYGAKRYASFLMIRDILCGLTDYRMTPEPAASAGEDKKASAFGLFAEEGEPDLVGQGGSRACIGSMEVENALRFMLKRQRKTGKHWTLRIISQPDSEILLKTVLSVCTGQDVEIEQIVCLDEDSSEGNNNIRTIYGLLPMLFGSVHYQSYYYYDKKDAHINTMSLLPVLVLAGDSAMVCSYRMDEGLVFFQKESVQFFHRQYDKIKSRTRFLTGYLQDNVTEWMDFLRSFVTELSVTEICIGATPCITYCLDEKMLNRYLQVGGEERRYLMETFVSNRDKVMKRTGTKAILNIFSEAGLRHFMETGRSDEYPDACYTPVAFPDRVLILERMIGMAEQGYIRYVLTNPDRLTLDEKLLIYVNEKVIFQYRQNTHLSQYFSVTERGIRRSFQEFVAFAGENNWICRQEETLRKMKELLVQYRQKL